MIRPPEFAIGIRFVLGFASSEIACSASDTVGGSATASVASSESRLETSAVVPRAIAATPTSAASVMSTAAEGRRLRRQLERPEGTRPGRTRTEAGRRGGRSVRVGTCDCRRRRLLHRRDHSDGLGWRVGRVRRGLEARGRERRAGVRNRNANGLPTARADVIHDVRRRHDRPEDDQRPNSPQSLHLPDQALVGNADRSTRYYYSRQHREEGEDRDDDRDLRGLRRARNGVHRPPLRRRRGACWAGRRRSSPRCCAATTTGSPSSRRP